ncbi:MAG: hypothetical protein LAP87_01180 [Acidobacteriia bacterium]|nr:hypothetical protein [Terriglobia bacterium]
MNIDFRPFFGIGIILAVVVIVMIVYRKIVARKEDDTLHFLDSGAVQQAVVGHKLEAIDKWGKLLTVITVVYLLLVGVAYVYQGFVHTATTTGV